MDSTEIVNTIFSGFMPQLTSFVSGDFLTVIGSMLSLILIVFAGTKIFELMNMTGQEKNARSAFKNYRTHQGTWFEPIAKRKYNDALDKYESSESYEKSMRR